MNVYKFTLWPNSGQFALVEPGSVQTPGDVSGSLIESLRSEIDSLPAKKKYGQKAEPSKQEKKEKNENKEKKEKKEKKNKSATKEKKKKDHDLDDA